MDVHGQIGPEKGDYAADVKRVADVLETGRTAYVKLADRGTSYRLVLIERESLAFPALDPDSPIDGVPPGSNYLFVAVIEHGAYWFRLDTYPDPGYVADKLDLHEADGEVLAEFLSRLGFARLAPA